MCSSSNDRHQLRRHDRCFGLLPRVLSAGFLCAMVALPSGASDWDEGASEKSEKATSTGDSGEQGRGSTKLQGQVEHTSVAPGKKGSRKPEAGAGGLDGGPVPVMPDIPKKGYQSAEPRTDGLDPKLAGKAIDDELRGMVQDGSLKPMTGLRQEDPSKLLHGNALKQSTDPDEEDQELMVEWDRWRNRFLRAVQLGVQEIVNNPDPEDYERPRVDPVTGRMTTRYPLGTGAAFSCQITRDGSILNLEVIEPSGFSRYDRIVLKAVRQLEGTRLLNFPRASQRKTVTQAARIKTASSADFQYHKFGDVERVRSSPQE